VAPGVFSANPDGKGVAAANAVRVNPFDGPMLIEKIAKAGYGQVYTVPPKVK